MEKRYSAEEVANIIMNGGDDDDGDESSASSDSIASTTEDESFEEPSSASEVELEEEADYLSSSFISSRVSSRMFMTMGKQKRPRTRGPRGRGQGQTHIRQLPSFQDEMARLGDIDAISADLETCSEISESSEATAMSNSSLTSSSATTLMLEYSVASPLPINFCSPAPQLEISLPSLLPKDVDLPREREPQKAPEMKQRKMLRQMLLIYGRVQQNL